MTRLKYFILGTLVISSLAIAQGYMSQLTVGNVRLSGNTVSTTNSNGDLTFDLNGTGSVIFSDLTASRVPYLDASKKLTSSSVTNTELGYLGSVTSSLCGINQSCTLTGKTLTGNVADNLVSAGGGVFNFNTTGAITVPSGTDTLVGKATTDTLTNKTIDADGSGNSITNIENADIKTGAAIARAKLAAGTASQVLINDGDGVMSSEASLAITRGGTGQATAIAGFNALSPLASKGDLIGSTGATAQALTVGANGTVLTADSSNAVGFAWASAGAASHPLAYISVTGGGNVTLTASNEYVKLLTASATITLYTAAGNDGRMINLHHAGTSLTNTFTLNTTSAQTIGDVASGAYVMHTKGEILWLISDGANWQILDHKTDTAWTSYTPTTTGMGTPSDMDFKYRREGDSVRVRGKGVNGVVSAAVGTLSLPGGASIDTAKLPTVAQTAILGVMYARISATNTATPGATRGPWPITTQSGVATAVMLTQGDVDLGNDGSGMIFKAMNWNTIANNSEAFTVEFLVPISGWQH